MVYVEPAYRHCARSVRTRTLADALQLSLSALVGVILIAATLFVGTFNLTSSQFKAIPVVLAVPYVWGGPYGVFFAIIGAGLVLITLGLFIDILAIRRENFTAQTDPSNGHGVSLHSIGVVQVPGQGFCCAA